MFHLGIAHFLNFFGFNADKKHLSIPVDAGFSFAKKILPRKRYTRTISHIKVGSFKQDSRLIERRAERNATNFHSL